MNDKVFKTINSLFTCASIPVVGVVKRPVFITGVGRSGTTMLCQLLGHHPDIGVYPNEANTLWHPKSYPWHVHASTLSIKPYWMDPVAFSEFTINNYSPKELAALHKSFVLFSRLSGAKSFVLKSAMITFMLPFIKKIFPDASFIIMLRDGRSVAYSYAVKQAEKNQRPGSGHDWSLQIGFDELLEFTALTWQRQVDYLQELQTENAIPKDELYELRYEFLCNDPEREMEKIFEFIGVFPGRYNSGALKDIKSTNTKAYEKLTPSQLEKLNVVMSRGLKVLGYV